MGQSWPRAQNGIGSPMDVPFNKQPRSKELRFVTIYPTVTCYNQLGRLGSSHLEIPQWILSCTDASSSFQHLSSRSCPVQPFNLGSSLQRSTSDLTRPLPAGFWYVGYGNPPNITPSFRLVMYFYSCHVFFVLIIILKFTKDQHVLAIYLCQWHFSLGACFGTWNVEIVPFGLIAATLSLESIWRPSCSFLFWLQKKQQPTAPFSFPHLLHLNSHANWATLATPWRMTCVLAIECWIPSFLQASCEEVAVGGFLLTLLSGEVPNCNQISCATPLIAPWPLARSNGAAESAGGRWCQQSLSILKELGVGWNYGKYFFKSLVYLQVHVKYRDLVQDVWQSEFDCQRLPALRLFWGHRVDLCQCNDNSNSNSIQ